MGAQLTAVAGSQTREAQFGPLAPPALVWRPPRPGGWVVFAQGNSRQGERDKQVARMLHARSLGTLLPASLRLTLGTEDDGCAQAEWLIRALEWLEAHEDAGARPVGLFGAGSGGTAALRAAAVRPQRVAAVVACGSRPDLARECLPGVVAPVLLVVAGQDIDVLRCNREALPLLAGERRLEVVPGAGGEFEEPGALETVGHLAADWLLHRLPGAAG